MFVWMSGFQKSLANTDFNMFVDEWTSANESHEHGTETHHSRSPCSGYEPLDKGAQFE